MSDELRANVQPISNAPSPSAGGDVERDPIVRAVHGVVQRTAAALSPWVRRAWRGTGAAPIAYFSGVSQRMMPSVTRLQRLPAAPPTQAGSEPAAQWVDRFSNAIVRRHTASAQIGKHTQVEPRRSATPPPSQLPLPGVMGGARVQRKPDEMSLDQLAAAYQARAAEPVGAVSDISRQFDESSAPHETGLPSVAAMQDAARRAAQMRAASASGASSSSETPIQRSPDMSPAQLAEVIGERIRQARATRGADDAARVPPPGTSSATPPVQRSVPSAAAGPPRSVAELQARIDAARAARESASAPSAPTPAVQRQTDAAATNPAPAPQPGPTAPARGFDDIEARIRAARAQRESGGPAAPEAAVQRTPAGPPPGAAEIEARIRAARAQAAARATVAPVQRSPNKPPPNPRTGGGGTPIVGAGPLTPPSPTPPPIDIQRAVEELAGPRELPAVPVADPASPGFSVTEALKQRLQAKAAQSQSAAAPERSYTLPASPDVASPVFSRSAAIQRRIDEAQLQRAAERQVSTDPGDPNYSRVADIQARIAARQAQGAGAQAGEVNATASVPSTLGAESVQRSPDPLSSTATAPPPTAALRGDAPAQPTDTSAQARRMRAFSRTEMVTPERKTGDFLAGEDAPPRAGMGRSPVQRSQLPPPAPAQS